jgi:cobalt/nickel transport system permease protein
MGLDEENYGVSGNAADKAESVQKKTAILPDYAFPDSESAAGTSVSGIVGSVIVAGLAVLICLIGGFFRKKNRNSSGAENKAQS